MNLRRLELLTLLSILLFATAVSPWAEAGGLKNPDFSPGAFSSPRQINNPYWPLTAGDLFLYFTETEDGCEWNIVQVTYESEFDAEVALVDVITVLDIEWLDESEDCDEVDYGLGHYNPLTPRDPDNFPGDGVLTEFTYDWYAQDSDDNIWYLGENTLSFDWDECEGPTRVTDFGIGCPDGSFTAGVDDAEAGIVMLGDPSPGDFYRQEFDEDNAEDWGKVLRLFKLDGTDCLKTKEWTPLERGSIEHKYYCTDNGQDFPGLYLIEKVSGGPKEWTELVEISTYADPGPTPP